MGEQGPTYNSLSLMKRRLCTKFLFLQDLHIPPKSMHYDKWINFLGNQSYRAKSGYLCSDDAVSRFYFAYHGELPPLLAVLHT